MTENTTETPEVDDTETPGTELALPSPRDNILTRADLRNRTTDSWTEVLVEVGTLAKSIAGTDFVPDSFKGSVPAVAATILQGRELGFPPMTALGSLHSIKGRVGLSAEAMRALVLQAGHEIVVEISTSDKCRIKGRRKGSEEWTTVEWTIADARQASLLNGSGWKNYPRQMLQARASAELCRLAFPDVTRGLASLEEIEQYDVLPGEETAPVGGTGTKVKRRPRKKAEKADVPAPDLDGDTPQTGEEVAPGAGEAPADATSSPSTPAAAPAGPENGASAEDIPPTPAPTPEGPAADTSAEAPPLPDAEPYTGGHEAEPDEEGIVDAEIVEDPPEVVPAEQAEPLLSPAQQTALIAKFNELGITDRAERLYMSEVIIDRRIETAKELKRSEASSILDTLAMCTTTEQIRAAINATAEHREKGNES